MSLGAHPLHDWNCHHCPFGGQGIEAGGRLVGLGRHGHCGHRTEDPLGHHQHKDHRNLPAPCAQAMHPECQTDHQHKGRAGHESKGRTHLRNTRQPTQQVRRHGQVHRLTPDDLQLGPEGQRHAQHSAQGQGLGPALITDTPQAEDATDEGHQSHKARTRCHIEVVQVEILDPLNRLLKRCLEHGPAIHLKGHLRVDGTREPKQLCDDEGHRSAGRAALTAR